MTAPRVNIYGFPHKGLRNGLSQLLFQVSKTDITNEASVAELKTLGQQMVTLLTLHQEAEDSIVLVDLESRVPGSTKHNHDEHERLHTMVEAIGSQLDALEVGGSPAATARLLYTVSEFMSEYFKHMDEEEHEINQAIWDAFTDHEIMGWQPKIMDKLTPEQKMLWFRFIIPALNPMERQIMMGGMRESVPAEVYAGVINFLKDYMSEEELAPLAA